LHTEIRALAQAVTVSETYFFRNIEQFQALREIVIPNRLSAHAQTRKLSLLSAGCASGEEAYSLAIVAKECLPDSGWQSSVRAIDVNPSSLAKAQLGRYSMWALRETPAAVQRQWFRAEGRDFLLDTTVRDLVCFEERNLVHDDADVWRAGAYDVVFCRNVLMYFVPAHAQAIVQRITRALKPGGYLFLGHAETLRGLSQDYHLCHTHGTFYYQRKDVLAAADGLTAPENTSRPGRNGPRDLGWAETWIETVQRASSRIQTLATASPPAPQSAATSAVLHDSRPQLGFALELLKQERFAEALELLRALPSRFARDPDALLLRAVLLTHSGQLELAEKACRELLAVDDLNAGAHYLLALCREGVGDRGGAVENDQAATYLDPSFAMPRLHLGLLARRVDDPETARRELGQALTLLQREEVSRIIFFGGGFSREALVALCRAELRAAGGKL
jgi:chemotaxis protein methyltransferase CheR